MAPTLRRLCPVMGVSLSVFIMMIYCRPIPEPMKCITTVYMRIHNVLAALHASVESWQRLKLQVENQFCLTDGGAVSWSMYSHRIKLYLFICIYLLLFARNLNKTITCKQARGRTVRLTLYALVAVW